MSFEARCAAEPPEGLSIYPGRTCGFAEIFVGLTELPIDLEEDRAARAVGSDMLARDAVRSLALDRAREGFVARTGRV